MTDIKGGTLKVYNATKGDDQINVRSGELPAGTYIQTLFVNDKKVESKQMVITKCIIYTT